MNRYPQIQEIRGKLARGEASVGSWMQIPDSSVAEILGRAGYDWVAVDLEHGTMGSRVLPDLFRAIELGGALPLARVAEGSARDCKRALDAGAGGVILPMIETAAQLRNLVSACAWPPAGTRGVGFSRANLFGKDFDRYRDGEARAPLVVAMIEHINAVADLDGILSVPGLDAIFIGPYDLSASMGLIGEFDHPDFKATIDGICARARAARVPHGQHVVAPSPGLLSASVQAGHQFIAYSMDAVFLTNSVQRPVTASP
ncbi:HpcH/HpaI aldolase/citrate lyase family protein [Rhizobium puerariae]|uniref:HpcH/HpaI aldolase/citrate lyase family protein n=1 Tax=Rhizobium puerariae TaxID=1585791 RepID=A0ABV6ACJ6_9HYPH